MRALTPTESRELAVLIRSLTPLQKAGFYYFTAVKEQDPYQYLESLKVLKHGTHDQKTHGNWATGVSTGVASDITRFTQEWGGLSINMVDGSMPDKGFMVAKPPEFSHVVDEADFLDPVKGPKILSEYMRKHKNDLATGKNYLGTWLNGGKIYLDVSENIMDKAEAVRVGAERNQKAIWDVVNQTEIDTGGTGEVQKGSQGDSTSRHLKDDGRGNRRILQEDLGKTSRKVIYFEAGLVPTLKHLSGQHDQSTHGNWATQGYSEEDASEISRMSEVGPSLDDLNNYLASEVPPDMSDLEDFVSNDSGLYEQATEDIEFRVEERMARLQAEFPLHEYTEQEKMNIYEEVQRDMIQDFIANDDGTIAQMWQDANGTKIDTAELINSFTDVYEMTHRGTALDGSEVTLSAGIEGLTLTTNNSFELTGNIYAGDASWAGEWKRDFTQKSDGSWEVEHSFLKLEDEYQGTGFGKKFLAQSEAWYIAKGFDSIKVGTAWDGARHWARAGFDWDMRELATNMGQLEAMRMNIRFYEDGKYLPEFDSLMNRMVTDYDGEFWSFSKYQPVEKMPTPAEFAMIGYKDKISYKEDDQTVEKWAGKSAMYGLHMNYRKFLREADSRDMETPIDRDGDGIIFDGTPRAQIAPAKTGQ